MISLVIAFAILFCGIVVRVPASGEPLAAIGPLAFLAALYVIAIFALGAVLALVLSASAIEFRSRPWLVTAGVALAAPVIVAPLPWNLVIGVPAYAAFAFRTKQRAPESRPHFDPPPPVEQQARSGPP